MPLPAPDDQLLDQLARVYMQAALDRLLVESASEETDDPAPEPEHDS